MGTTRLAVVSVAALLLLSCVAVSPSEVKIHAPRNWGNLPDGIGHRAMPMSMHAGEEFDPETSPWVEKVGERPQVYYYHNFLTEREVSHMISVAAPQMKRSMVVGGGGNGVVDDIRTSYGAFLRRLEDPVIAGIEHRISMATHVPLAHQEDIQVLRYSKGQKYGAHYDSAYDKDDTNGPRFRLATFYMYLSDVEEGGETAFPHSRWLDRERQTAGVKYSDCAKDGVAALPRKGNAVMFWDTKVGSIRQDKWSMHAGCPVLKGTKWTAVKWIHAKPFGGPYPPRPLATSADSLARAERLMEEKRARQEVAVEACVDKSEGCRGWADAGECQNNPGFMREQCKLSCGVCCPEGDVLCERRRKRRVNIDPHTG